ncbi:arsH protein [Pseudomonas aeruginosa]|nr:arsH protein [Pseudomonas aeruginosa]
MRKVAVSEARLDLPNIDAALFQPPDAARLLAPERAGHAPRFLLLYGSLRERSYSRFATEEAARILRALGGETRMFNPSGLPLVDDAPSDHPKVQELHALTQWAEAMVWCSPERHGAMTGLMKNPDRLDSAVGRRGAPDPGQDAGGDAGIGRLTVVQRGQPDARAGPLDAHADYPQSVLGRQGVSGVRRRWSHEAFGLLRPHRGR